MSAKKKEETIEIKTLKVIANVEETMKLLKEIYEEHPSNPIGSIISAQELTLLELRKYHRS